MDDRAVPPWIGYYPIRELPANGRGFLFAVFPVNSGTAPKAWLRVCLAEGGKAG
jgi:hypothetical protein